MMALMLRVVLSTALQGAMANDASPGLVGEKQQKQAPPHQCPPVDSADIEGEPCFCRLPRQSLFLPRISSGQYRSSQPGKL